MKGRSEVYRNPFPTGRWVGPAGDHFDGVRFLNQEPTAHHGVGDLLKWQSQRDPGEWKRIDAAPGPKPPERVTRGIRITFIGHATLLVQMDGINAITDPLLGDRSSPLSWVGPRRYRPPGIRFEDLPPIDLVLVSHNHYDHLCVGSIERLAKAHSPRMLSGLGNAALLASCGAEADELDWWESRDVAPKMQATFVPAQHFSGRGVSDRDRTLWGGFVLEGPSGRVYFAGDTGMGIHFAQIKEKLGPPRVALLPIGAYRPRWFMKRVHVSPDEALEAARILGAETSVGMHFGTFRLADDGMDEPVRDLQECLRALGDAAPRFVVLEHGEGRDLASDQRKSTQPRKTT